jgi:hypothetical protein
MSQKFYDVKHVLLELHEDMDWENQYTTFFVEFAPFGRVNILIKDSTLALLVHEGADTVEQHRHYGELKCDLIEGTEIRRKLGAFIRENGVLLGIDGSLRVSGDGNYLRECIEKGEPSKCMWYIKIHHLVIFPKK